MNFMALMQATIARGAELRDTCKEKLVDAGVLSNGGDGGADGGGGGGNNGGGGGGGVAAPRKKGRMKKND
jgi:hypothetical protein